MDNEKELKEVYKRLTIHPPEAFIIQIPHDYASPAQIKKDILTFFNIMSELNIRFYNQPSNSKVSDYIFQRNREFVKESIMGQFEQVLFGYHTGLVIYIEKQDKPNYTLLWDEDLEEYEMDTNKIYTVLTITQFLQKYSEPKIIEKEKINLKRRTL